MVILNNSLKFIIMNFGSTNFELYKLCTSSTGSKKMSGLIKKLIERGVINSEKVNNKFKRNPNP